MGSTAGILNYTPSGDVNNTNAYLASTTQSSFNQSGGLNSTSLLNADSTATQLSSAFYANANNTIGNQQQLQHAAQTVDNSPQNYSTGNGLLSGNSPLAHTDMPKGDNPASQPPKLEQPQEQAPSTPPKPPEETQNPSSGEAQKNMEGMGQNIGSIGQLKGGFISNFISGGINPIGNKAA